MPTNTIIHKLTELLPKASAIWYTFNDIRKVQLTDDSWSLASMWKWNLTKLKQPQKIRMRDFVSMVVP